MANLNHFEIARILHADIVGPVSAGHGQIESVQIIEDVFSKRGALASAALIRDASINKDRVIQAFLEVRNDRGSPDLYVADPDRNQRFISRCRELGLTESEYSINKTLFNARKANQLKGLNSQRTVFNHSEYAFASEFAATELRYLTGASIDDILCDPSLAAEFDRRASKMAPGFPPLRYRWALLSIRKAGRQAKWKPEYEMPELSPAVKLFSDEFDQVPPERGVYILFEGERALYTRGSNDIHHGLNLHRQNAFFEPVLEKLWRPDPDAILFSYAPLQEAKLVRPVEQRLIKEKQPLFNILRAA